MTVKKMLMLQGLGLVAIVMGCAIPLGMPYEFNVPLCSTKEGMQAATNGGGCQSCPGYNYLENARINIIELVAGGHPVIINAAVIAKSPSKTGAKVNFDNIITIINSKIAHRPGESLSIDFVSREDADAE